MTSAVDFSDCLHICCSVAAAGAVKALLKNTMGIPRPRIFHSSMSENVGPLSLLDRPEERFSWFLKIGFDVHVYEGMGADGQEAMIARWQSFWMQIDQHRGPCLLWFSSLSAQDQSLLLSILNRIGRTRQLFLVDVAECAGSLCGAVGVDELSPDDLHRWISQVRVVDAALAETSSARYSALIAAPKDLRLYGNGTLCELPINTIDDRILSQFSAEWTSLRRAAAQTPGAFGQGGYRDLNYSWLLWRLDALQQAGLIERRGGRFDPEFREDPLMGEVRLSA